jgi:ribonuclease I
MPAESADCKTVCWDESTALCSSGDLLYIDDPSTYALYHSRWCIDACSRLAPKYIGEPESRQHKPLDVYDFSLSWSPASTRNVDAARFPKSMQIGCATNGL